MAVFLITLKNVTHYYYNDFEENIYIYIYYIYKYIYVLNGECLYIGIFGISNACKQLVTKIFTLSILYLSILIKW